MRKCNFQEDFQVSFLEILKKFLHPNLVFQPTHLSERGSSICVSGPTCTDSLCDHSPSGIYSCRLLLPCAGRAVGVCAAVVVAHCASPTSTHSPKADHPFTAVTSTGIFQLPFHQPHSFHTLCCSSCSWHDS